SPIWKPRESFDSGTLPRKLDSSQTGASTSSQQSAEQPGPSKPSDIGKLFQFCSKYGRCDHRISI
ncbi:unnamed protein product, partial [Allacma fusca]